MTLVFQNRRCRVSLLLGLPTWCCLKQHRLFIVLIEKKLYSSDICKCKCSELQPVAITHFHKIPTVASGSYEQVTIQYNSPTIQYNSPTIQYNSPTIQYNSHTIQYNCPTIQYNSPNVLLLFSSLSAQSRSAFH